MALPRFPLSNLDSKMRVVLSGALVGMVWDNAKLGPAREETNCNHKKKIYTYIQCIASH